MNSEHRHEPRGTRHEVRIAYWRCLVPLVWCLVPLFTGCGEKQTSRTEHPAAGISDSVLAKSRLPGATGVGAALRLQDTAAARRALTDSIANP
jgi:hypothetical protein